MNDTLTAPERPYSFGKVRHYHNGELVLYPEEDNAMTTQTAHSLEEVLCAFPLITLVRRYEKYRFKIGLKKTNWHSDWRDALSEIGVIIP